MLHAGGPYIRRTLSSAFKMQKYSSIVTVKVRTHKFKYLNTSKIVNYNALKVGYRAQHGCIFKFIIH